MGKLVQVFNAKDARFMYEEASIVLLDKANKYINEEVLKATTKVYGHAKDGYEACDYTVNFNSGILKQLITSKLLKRLKSLGYTVSISKGRPYCITIKW